MLETHHVPLGLYGECREGLRMWRLRREYEECVILRDNRKDDTRMESKWRQVNRLNRLCKCVN